MNKVKYLFFVFSVMSFTILNGAIDSAANNSDADYYIKLIWLDSNKNPNTEFELKQGSVRKKDLGKLGANLGTVEVYDAKNTSKKLADMNKNNKLSCNYLNIYRVKDEYGIERVLISCGSDQKYNLKDIKSFTELDTLDGKNKFQVGPSTRGDVQSMYEKGILPIK